MSKSGRPKANVPAARPAPGRTAGRRGRPYWLRRWGWPIAGVAGVLPLLALLHPSFGGGTTNTGNDFNVVAYQGDSLLGGQKTAFSRVFAQKKPVVLNF